MMFGEYGSAGVVEDFPWSNRVGPLAVREVDTEPIARVEHRSGDLREDRQRAGLDDRVAAFDAGEHSSLGR